MATHLRKKLRRGKPVRAKHVKPRAKRHTKKASTPKRVRQWDHVFRSLKKAGLSEARAIMGANAAVGKSAAKKRHKKAGKNPVVPMRPPSIRGLRSKPMGTKKPDSYVIEAMTVDQAGHRIKHFYWNGTSFGSEKSGATQFRDSKAAMKQAKAILHKLPPEIATLKIAGV